MTNVPSQRRRLSTAHVVRAAADLADEAGWEAVTLAAVARRLEVRTPSLYAHLGGLTDLRTRICAVALDELAEAATKSVAGRSGCAAILALIDAHLDYGRRHPGRYAALQLRLPDSPAADDGVAAALLAGRRHADLLRAVLRDYELSGDAEVHAIRMVGSIVRGYVTIELEGGFAHSQPPSEASLHYIVDSLDSMLRTPRTP